MVIVNQNQEEGYDTKSIYLGKGSILIALI